MRKLGDVTALCHTLVPDRSNADEPHARDLFPHIKLIWSVEDEHSEIISLLSRRPAFQKFC